MYLLVQSLYSVGLRFCMYNCCNVVTYYIVMYLVVFIKILIKYVSCCIGVAGFVDVSSGEEGDDVCR